MFKFIKKAFIFIILTVLTQVGGLIYLFYQGINQTIQKKHGRKLPFYTRVVIFIIFYLIATFLLLPPIAKQFGRVPMPYYATAQSPIKPLTNFTYLLNRHYVNARLLKVIIRTAKDLNKEFPNSQIVYLDANFPFWNGFPLLPHLSHNDGKKLDLAFVYKDAETLKVLNTSPSFSGYGVYVHPQKGELDQPAFCKRKGHWQYGALEKITPQWHKEKIIVDAAKTKRLVQLLATHKEIGKIFIEPHLKTRWGLKGYQKIRFHGCHAVRHDDHIHVQL